MKAMDKRDWLPLRTSASKGHGTIVKILIEKGANKDAFTTDSLKMTALHIAAANGCYRTVLSLIENEADIHAVRGDGGTVLHSAAESGCVSIIATLLAAGAKLDSVDKEGRTVLLVAAAEGHAEAVESLPCAERDRNKKASWKFGNCPASGPNRQMECRQCMLPLWETTQQCWKSSLKMVSLWMLLFK